MLNIDMLKQQYKKDEASYKKLLKKTRQKRKGRLVAMKIINKRGKKQTVYINPEKNKKIQKAKTRSKYVDMMKVKLNEVAAGYVKSFNRMLNYDYGSKSSRAGNQRLQYRNKGQRFEHTQDNRIRHKLDNIRDKYGFSSFEIKKGSQFDRKATDKRFYKEFLRAANKARNFDTFFQDAKDVYRHLHKYEGKSRKEIERKIKKGFHPIDDTFDTKKIRGGATGIIDMWNGRNKTKLAMNIGLQGHNKKGQKTRKGDYVLYNKHGIHASNINKTGLKSLVVKPRKRLR